MYDHQKSSSHPTGAESAASAGPKVGGSTLTQQLALDDRAQAGRPMFEASPQWEPIEPAAAEPAHGEPPRPSATLRADSPAAPPAEAASVPSTAPDDAPGVTSDAGALEPDAAEGEGAAGDPGAHAARAAAPHDPLHVGHHTNAHAGPFEHKTTHANHEAPAIDGYNRGTVHSDKTTAHVFGRPGVVSHGHGLFQLKHDSNRYTYTAHGHTDVAVPFDTIHKAKLLSINSKAPHLSAHDKAVHKKEVAAGRSMRLALNPARPRQLSIEGVKTWCVLSWIDGEGGGAAWLPVKALAGNTHQIRTDVAHRAAHESPSLKLSASTPYIIRDDAVGQADDQDLKRDQHGTSHGRVLAPGAKGGDNVSHYLEKDVRKPVFQGDKPTGHTTPRGFVAICMNLPEGRTPPVADDTAIAGDTFFAFNETKFHREVPVYENGKTVSHRRQTWVFGHLGRQKGGAGPDGRTMEADPNRAGWVPLRVLRLP